MEKEEILNKYKYIKNIYEVMGFVVVVINIELDYEENRYRLEGKYNFYSVSTIKEVENDKWDNMKKEIIESVFEGKIFNDRGFKLTRIAKGIEI
jgi:hypothetical protein